MTQDNDDLLAQVFSGLPTIEGQTAYNATDRKEEAEMVANVRRVSNAFHDFIEKSGVVETNVTLEHRESHHEIITHVESHHEIVIGGGVQIHHEEHDNSIGHGASIKIQHEHFDIGQGAAVVESHEESHGIDFGASVMTTEMNPPEAAHFELGHGAAPHQDDEESVVSVRSGLSKATSVSVHSSVSQKSAQVFNDAPVILQMASYHSVSSHKSSVVPESHHSEVAHTHDQESTISLSAGSTLTGSDASKNTAIEQYVISAENHHKQHEHHEHHHHHHHQHAVHHHITASVDSTPIAPMKSEPLDALIEEFKLLHQRVPSEASSVVVAPVSVPPPPPAVPPPADSDTESDVVMTVKVTEYEFDSEDVKQTIEHPHKEHHYHHEEHVHHEDHVHHEEHLHHEDSIHHVEEHHHNGLDSHAIGHGVAPHHGSNEDSTFEHIEYEDVPHAPIVHHYEEHHELNHVPVQPSNEVPPVFFNSPVLIRKTKQTAQNLYDTVSEASARLHHHYEETDFHHHDSIHHESKSHHVHRELIPNLSGPHVREDLRPVHIVEEHHTTVVKTVPTPVAHVSPVVSQQEIRGLPRIDRREVLTPIVDIVPIVHKHTEIEQHHHHEDHHKHHHHDQQQHHVSREEKHYHKHDDQMSEILSGPSVRDLKSRFETGGEIQIHFGTNYISHKRSSSAPIHVENHHENHHHVEHHHHHEEPVHHHHKESVRHESVSISQPRLSHREVKESHQHHHHHDKKHHEHHHHHSHNEKHQHHEEKHHEHHQPVHHEHHHHEHHHHVHEKSLHHHEEHHHHEEVHHHVEQHFHAEEEEQLPVSALLSRYGGGAKLRRPDHFEKIEIYSRSSSVPNVAHEIPHHAETKSRTVTQSSVTTRGTRSQSTYSVQSTQRSHATTMTHENNLSHAHNHVAPIAPISPAAPVAAARSTSADHQSLRVVKSVRAFVSEWGQKDFRPPMSPVITVPRLPSSPKGQEMIHTYPEAVSRKSTVVSHVSHHGSEHQAIQQIDNAIQDDVSVCSQCSHPVKRKSVVSVVNNVNINGNAHHETNGNIIHIGEGVQSHVPEVHEEFVLTPLSERRAIFEQGLNRGYSINRKTHGELRPMVNVFID